MIKLELEVSELDYEALVDSLLPLMGDHLRSSGNPVGMLLSNGMSGGMAKRILRGMPKEQVEGLVADTINANSAKLSRKAEQIAAQQNVHVKVGAVRASVK